MVKNRIVAKIMTVLVVVLTGILSGCASDDYSATLKANWGFLLPAKAECTELYSKDSGASFLGDGVRYHIFSCEEGKYIDTFFSWKSTEEGMENHYPDQVTEWLEEIEVPVEKLPDFSKCRYWYQSKEDGSEIVLLWNSEENVLYVAESFL